MWWESENSEPQSHGVTQTFLAQGETEKYSKEKSTMSSRFMNSKCPSKSLLEIDFYYSLDNVLSSAARKFKEDHQL